MSVNTFVCINTSWPTAIFLSLRRYDAIEIVSEIYQPLQVRKNNEPFTSKYYIGIEEKKRRVTL